VPQVTAEVRLHGRRVGELWCDRGGSRFNYEDDLAAHDHFTLGQIFEDDPRAVRRVPVDVPPWFANLLPEGALRQQVIRDLGGGNIGNFTLLLRLGESLPGAVTVHAQTATAPEDDKYVDESPGTVPDHPLRHSLAGVQLKYSVSRERLTTSVTGNGGWWIVKLPDRSLRDLTVNEYVTMRWLATAGFEVPEVDLVRADAVKGLPEGLVAPQELVYLIERFDRSPGGRVHVEDFAQVADVAPMFKYSESGATYDGLARVIRNLTGRIGYLTFVRRLVAMIVIGNTDAHLKNWALLYSDGRTPSLAPVYDFHSLTVYQTYQYQPLALSVAGERMPRIVTDDHFRRLAETCGEDSNATVEEVRRTVHRLHEAWQEGISDEAKRRFDALAAHYARRLSTLRLGA
jgi:serine/threonine-protein kinase HipA